MGLYTLCNYIFIDVFFLFTVSLLDYNLYTGIDNIHFFHSSLSSLESLEMFKVVQNQDNLEIKSRGLWS